MESNPSSPASMGGQELKNHMPKSPLRMGTKPQEVNSWTRSPGEIRTLNDSHTQSQEWAKEPSQPSPQSSPRRNTGGRGSRDKGTVPVNELPSRYGILAELEEDNSVTEAFN
nr:hypothetical protein Iba_chr05eCG10750 [Ipomoea batatas]